MIYGLYLSASGALMESARHSVVANNVANVNTTGFKDDLAIVRARDAEATEEGLFSYATPMDALGGGAILSQTYTRRVQGAIQVTGNPFDMAIDGEGFFPVTDGAQVFYTRAGSFTRDTSGRLAMPDGTYFLADTDGRPILVPLEGEISITGDGTISVDGAVTGKVELVRFDEPGDLDKLGGNLWADRGGAASTANVGRIKHGALEISSVSPAAEMSKMILASRGYEMNMQLIRMQDQTLADLVALARLPM